MPDKYWNDDGSPTFYDKNNGNFTLPPEKFYKVHSEKVSHKFDVKESRTYILDLNINEVIGKKSWIRYGGGFIRKNFTPHNSATSCGGRWNEFVSKQFTQQTTK